MVLTERMHNGDGVNVHIVNLAASQKLQRGTWLEAFIDTFCTPQPLAYDTLLERGDNYLNYGVPYVTQVLLYSI